jgi:hypothetical protein
MAWSCGLVFAPICQASSGSTIQSRHQDFVPYSACSVLQIFRSRLDDFSRRSGGEECQEGWPTTYCTGRCICLFVVLLAHSWSSWRRRSRKPRKQRVELPSSRVLRSRGLTTRKRTGHDAYWWRPWRRDLFIESWTCEGRICESEEHGYHTP